MFHSNSLHSILSASPRRLWLTAVLMIFIAGSVLTTLRWQAYNHVEIDEYEKLNYQIALAQKEVSGLVRSVNIVLEQISQSLEQDDFVNAMNLGVHYKKVFPEIRSFTIVDKDGVIRGASIEKLIGGDRSQSGYYKEVKSNPDKNMVYLGLPFKDPLGASIMLYDRAVVDEKGKLKWIAIASVNLKYYDELLAKLINHKSQKISLVHGAGLILSDSSGYEQTRLQSVVSTNPLVGEHLANSQRQNFYKNTYDSMQNKIFLISSDVIHDSLPTSNRLVVTITEDAETVFERWNADTRIYILALILTSILILYLAYMHSIREQELLHSEGRFRDFTDTASDWIWEMDADLRFTLISEVFFNIANFKPEDLIGRTRWEYTTVESAGVSEEVWLQHQKDMESHQPFHNFRYRVIDADGISHHISLSGKPVYIDGFFIGYRGTGTNVTPLINAIDDARSAQHKAESASNAKSRFLSSMSHELRTPMNSILGYSQILELELRDTEHQESVEMILDAGHHLLSLIDEVLELSKIESEQSSYYFEDIDVLELLKECQAICAPLAEQYNTDIILAVDKIYLIHTDAKRFKQAMLNYLSNALKYGRQDGGIVHVTANESGGNLRISITDNGRGIVPERMNQLFIPFSRLGLEGGALPGAGLGLSITKKIIEDMHGTVGAKSELGKGSTFWLELPIDNKAV